MTDMRPSNSQRSDVRRMLLDRGWTEDYANGPLSKGNATWASLGRRRDSALGLNGRAHPDFLVEFSALIPARVIVAACEAAAANQAAVAA